MHSNHELQTATRDAGSGFLINGDWIYRSFHNDPALVGDDAAKALALIFGEGIFSLSASASGAVSGILDMGSGYVLDITGDVHQAPAPVGWRAAMAGKGRVGTPTAGWEYDYQIYPDPMWPNAVNQIPSLVGTTIRAVPHNGEPAGVTASIIMVRR